MRNAVDSHQFSVAIISRLLASQLFNERIYWCVRSFFSRICLRSHDERCTNTVDINPSWMFKTAREASAPNLQYVFSVGFWRLATNEIGKCNFCYLYLHRMCISSSTRNARNSCTNLTTSSIRRAAKRVELSRRYREIDFSKCRRRKAKKTLSIYPSIAV